MMHTKKPIIGITSSDRTTEAGVVFHELKQEYTAAIIAAGGIPVVLPVATASDGDISELVAALDGVVLSGGGDLDPQRYAPDQPDLSHGIDPKRDVFELALLSQLIAQAKPFLAICRGCQVLNIAMGGDLIQDIATQLPAVGKHDYFTDKFAPDKLVHNIQALPGSLLARLVGTEPVHINSRHHQAIAHLGSGLTVSAQAEDGIVEAVELDGHSFGLGVQWHPESLVGSTDMQALFSGFIAAALAH